MNNSVQKSIQDDANSQETAAEVDATALDAPTMGASGDAESGPEDGQEAAETDLKHAEKFLRNQEDIGMLRDFYNSLSYAYADRTRTYGVRCHVLRSYVRVHTLRKSVRDVRAWSEFIPYMMHSLYIEKTTCTQTPSQGRDTHMEAGKVSPWRI